MERIVDLSLLLIYFVYGLAFWAMGLAVLLESGRAGSQPEAGRLHWLAAFGISHGSHEWLEAYLLLARSVGTPLPAWLDWLRLGLLAASFAFLFAYGLTSVWQIPRLRGKPHWPFALPVMAAVWIMVVVGVSQAGAPVQWTPTLDAVSRYVLAVPAAALASMALLANARLAGSQARRTIASNLRLASLGFAGYALAQLFVHRLSWFPANFVNQEAFRSLTGVPIQAIRAVMAALISAGLLRAMQAAEHERKVELDAAHQARLAAVEQQDALRRDLLRHVVRSQEDERARIARELHDQVAQLLSAFSLQLGALRAKLKRADTIDIVDRLQDLSRQMSATLYGLVRDLRPSHLDNLGLVPAIKFLLSQDFGPKGLDVALHLVGSPRPLGGLVDTVLFRVAQESLTNIVRHANVDQASVELQYDSDRVILRICDHGRGFDPSQPLRPPRGWGLAGMRERVEAAGGQLKLTSESAQGTTVEVMVPLGLAASEEPGNE